MLVKIIRVICDKCGDVTEYTTGSVAEACRLYYNDRGEVSWKYLNHPAKCADCLDDEADEWDRRAEAEKAEAEAEKATKGSDGCIVPNPYEDGGATLWECECSECRWHQRQMEDAEI